MTVHSGKGRDHHGARPEGAVDEAEVLAAIRRAARSAGNGLYVGSGSSGPAWAPPEQAVLVLGPPRSGKTSALVIPSVLAAAGAVVSTSTKPDVLVATARSRLANGPCFVYDPSGTVEPPRGVQQARWSPVTMCSRWDDALLLAGRLVSVMQPAGHTSRVGGVDHWTERAQALLAPLLHAAALRHSAMSDVLRWVDRREASHAMGILEAEGRDNALDQLVGITATDPREQSGIWSTASGVLAAYRSEAALATTVAPNFDAKSFCTSGATLYVCATGSRQALAAPLVVGLLSEIRDAAYSHFAEQVTSGAAPPDGAAGPRTPVVLALDEVANIAPLPDLPTMVSEGGGQGVVTLACLQDLSQARARWGERADGFLSLFGTTVVLPGIGDVRTLEAVSTLAGDRDVRTRSFSQPALEAGRGLISALANRVIRGRRAVPLDRTPTVTTSVTQRRVLPPDVIARGQPGAGLMIDERNRMSWVGLTRCYESRPWCWVVDTAEPRRDHRGPGDEHDPGREHDRGHRRDPGHRSAPGADRRSSLAEPDPGPDL